MPTNTEFMVARDEVLTPEQERELSIRWCDNKDLSAREMLFKHNMRFVCRLARRHLAPSTLFDLDDLISIGSLGLEHALRKYDYKRNIRLSTYAGYWIENYICRYITQNMSMFEVPVKFAYDAVFSKHDHYSKEDMAIIVAHDSLNNKVRVHGEETQEEFIDFIPQEHFDSPESMAIRNIETQWMLNSIERLPPNERMVINRCLLNGETLMDISADTGIPRTKLNNLSRSGQEKLRKWKNERGE